MDTRAAQKAATRHRLKQAGRDAFAAHGVAGANISHIAAAAGVAHGTFYVHFPDKHALLAELVDDLNEGLLAALAPRWAALPVADLPSLLRDTAERFLDHWLAHRELVGAAVQHLGATLPMRAATEGFNPATQGALVPWLRHLLGDSGPKPELLAQALLSAWLRVGLQVLFAEGVSREDGVTVLVHLTAGALRSPHRAEP